MIDRNESTFIIGLDGGLRKVPAHMVNALQKQGWHIVVNPKRQYFPEYDRTSPHYKEPGSSEAEIETLQVEVV